MTKADIIDRIYEKVGFSKQQATDVVEATFEIIKGHLEKGEKVKISGFGNFDINTKSPRNGRNPQTGDEITIKGRRVLTFKASTILKETVNKTSSTAPQVPPTSVIPDWGWVRALLRNVRDNCQVTIGRIVIPSRTHLKRRLIAFCDGWQPFPLWYWCLSNTILGGHSSKADSYH